MRIRAWRVPPYDNGTYLIVDDRGDAVCIDQSMGERDVMAGLREDRVRLLAILNTHGHEDNIWMRRGREAALRPSR